MTTYRVVAEVLPQMLPLFGGKDPEILRRHTLKIGVALRSVPRPSRNRERRQSR
jgi:hypothetical protein